MAFKRSGVRASLSPPSFILATLLRGLWFFSRLQSNKKQHFDPAYLHQYFRRWYLPTAFLLVKQTNYSGSIPLISTTRKPALELCSGAFSFSGCKYRTPSATSHCRGCLHKVSICKAKPITVLLAHAKQQPCQCAPRAGPHRCDQSDHKLQFAYRWGAANPARG